MSDAWIIGSHSTPFGRHGDLDFKALTRQTYLGVLADAGLAGSGGAPIESAWFGNCLMDTWGQGSIRGQVCTVELVDEGLFPRHVPVINVEGACATASMALHAASKEIRSGDADVVLALGVEKVHRPEAATDPAVRQAMFDSFDAGMDNFDRSRLLDEYAEAAAVAGRSFEHGPGRTLFMDTYAMQAALHMHRFGTTQAQIAASAAKNHTYGSLNPNAQYRFAMTVDEVLADREVSWPLTRSMCAPIGDGAASAIVCSERFLAARPEPVRARAVRIMATALTGGTYRAVEEPSLSWHAAQRAYARAGIAPADVDVAEVHDATSFGEIHQVEAMGFCDEGQGGPFVAAGETGPGGTIPVNTGGGLVSKGHPVGATGLSMVNELVTQLRGEAGERQVADARVALQENGGGVMGLEEAACSVTLLARSDR
ncbi:MAG: thiolase family protein [Actinomycetota bacterium]